MPISVQTGYAITFGPGINPDDGLAGAGGGPAGPIPTISGTPQVGQTMTSSAVSVWNVGGVAKSFLSPSTTYVPVPGDVGMTLTATAGGKTSLPSTAVIDEALPAVSPPLAYGVTLSIDGDSIAQQNGAGIPRSGDATQGGVQSRATGELTQVLALEQRVNATNFYDQSKTTSGTNRLSNGSNQGISNQTSTQVTARIADLIAMGVGVTVYAAGTNNTTQFALIIGNGLTSDVGKAIADTRAAGKAIIVATIRPNALSNENINRAKADIVAINAAIRAYVASLADPLVVLWDAYKQYDRGDGYIDPFDCYDRGLHPNERGAELGAWGNDPANPAPHSLTFAIRKLVGAGNVYNDIMTANANVLLNPTLTGTGGSIDTAGGTISGVAPTNWRWERQSTPVSTLVCSVVANAGTGGQSAVAVITPVGSADYERFNFRLAAFTQNIGSLSGKWAQFFAEVETDGTPWLMAPQVGVVEVNGSSLFQAGIGFQPSLNPGGGNFISGMRPIARRRLIMSEPILLSDLATGLQPSIQFAIMPNGAIVPATGTATVKVHRAWMSTVPNPKTAWNS